MTFINPIKASIFYSILLISAWFGLLFLLSPAIPFIFFNRPIYFRWSSAVMGYYLLMLTCLLEDLLGIKIAVTGDDLTKDKNKRSLIILNHRTRLDWMFIWLLHSRFKILAQLKIVLKAQLKHLPGLGWAIQHTGYLFLEREWKKDQQRIKNIIGYYQSCQSPVSLLIFPEGTNLTNETKTKSNNYATKQTIYNRPYDYCLHPHVTGFTYLLNTMRSDDIINSVDDVTIGYEGNFPKNELDLLKGHFPKTVHCHVKRYDVNDLPKDDEKIGLWLQKRWDEKEDRLKAFYSNNQFDSSSKRINDEQVEANTRFRRRLALFLWILLILFWSCCFIAYIQIKLYVLIVCLLHLIMEIFANGIIDFVCDLDAKHRQKKD